MVRGTLVQKAAPASEHSLAQMGIVRRVGERYSRKPGGRFPGGWWILPELDVQLGVEVFRPDICGFRRERVPVVPPGRPVLLVPDWVCEILSPSNPERDRVEKLQSYFAAGVPHYWLLDPQAGTLEVLRRTDLAYAVVLSAHRGQTVRAEPFGEFELSVDELLGADPGDEQG